MYRKRANRLFWGSLIASAGFAREFSVGLDHISRYYAQIVLLRPATCLSVILAVSFFASGQAPTAQGDVVSPVISCLSLFEVGL